MLTGLRIVNYQSHKRTDVPLGLFTVITGPSNVGKSSMIRAGSLAARNASGTSYIRVGAKSCAVILTGVSADGTSLGGRDRADRQGRRPVPAEDRRCRAAGVHQAGRQGAR